MSNGILFSYIPGSGLIAPGQFFEVNSGGQYQPQTRLILIGYKVAAGSLALDTPTPCASQNDADSLAGPRSMLREMYRLAALNAPSVPISLAAIAEPVTTRGAKTITFASLPAAGQGVIEVCGRRIAVAVSGSDTVTTVAAAVSAAINAYYDMLTNAMLPAIAASALGVVTVTAAHAGAIMNDIDIHVPAGPSNVFAAAGVTAIAQTVAGTGVPDISATLAAIGDDPADFIVSPFADSGALSAAGAALGDASGRWSWGRQAYGHYWAPYTDTYSGLASFGAGLNDRHVSIVGRFSDSVSPSWEWIAARAAVESPWLSDVTLGGVSRNQSGRQILGVRGPRNRSILWGYNARNSLLGSGISTCTVDRTGAVLIDKTVTSYKTGTSGQPDSVFRDVQSVYQAAGALAYVRFVLDAEHGRKAFAASNPGNLGAITTPADIKASIIHACTVLAARGLIQDVEALARNIIVRVNETNPARCDVLLPIERVNPLDIIAVNAIFYQAHPSGF